MPADFDMESIDMAEDCGDNDIQPEPID